MDSNYISLSRLSSTDRGLGDKTPAERKRFTSNIIDNLEIYNSMYKTLNKKSLIYKSHIGTLHTKIQNIGDKATLEQRLVNLKNREAELNARIMSLNNQIVVIQAKNSIDDEEAKKIQDATTRVEELKSQLKESKYELDKAKAFETLYNDSVERNGKLNDQIIILRTKLADAEADKNILFNKTASLKNAIAEMVVEKYDKR